MVYVLLADGFEEIEALMIVDVLRRANIKVQTVAIADINVKGTHDIIVKADIKMDEVILEDISLLYLPGGMPGTRNLNMNKKVQQIIEYCFEKNVYIAAICAAPSILGNMGLLKNRNVVCYPGFEAYLSGAKINKKAKYIADGNILTAVGVCASADFAFMIVERLADKATADYVKEKMLYEI